MARNRSQSQPPADVVAQFEVLGPEEAFKRISQSPLYQEMRQKHAAERKELVAEVGRLIEDGATQNASDINFREPDEALETGRSVSDVIEPQMQTAVAWFWQSWFHSRCLDTIFRKVLYYLSATGAAWKERELELMRATLVIPFALEVSDDQKEHEILAALVQASRDNTPKYIVRSLYDEPYAADPPFQGELFSTAVTEPVELDPTRLIIFLVGPTGHAPLRALGLILPEAMTKVENVPSVVHLHKIPLDVAKDEGTKALDVTNEADLIGCTMRYWVDALFEHAMAAPRWSTPSLSYQPLFFPPPPLPDSRPDVVQRSVLPKIFRVIQNTLCPDHPDKVGSYLLSCSRDGTVLYTLAKSDNYPLTVPDVHLLTEDGLNWRGMGIAGRAAVFQQQVVARYAGADITPEELRDTRVTYASQEGIREAVAIPISGGSEKASGLGRAVHSVHSYGSLYVFTRQRGLLKTAHVLWLREFATLIGEYFGWASASSMRERQLARDREVGYRSILASVDSERIELLAPFLEFIAKQVDTMERTTTVSREDDADALANSVLAEPPRLTFLYLHIAGDQQTTGWYPRGEVRERVLFRVREIIGKIEEQWRTKRWVLAAPDEPVCYQGGILTALVLNPTADVDDLLLIGRRFLTHCRSDWGLPGQPSFGLFCFQRPSDELAALGFGARAGTGDVGHHALHMALRRFDLTFNSFRKAFEQEALRFPGLRTYIAREDSEGDLHRIGPQPENDDRFRQRRAPFDTTVARTKSIGQAR